MNPLRLLVLLVSLPLFLGGCGEKEEPVAEVKPELEGVNAKKLEAREGIRYRKGSDAPYTGKVFNLYKSGKKESEANLKNGQYDGLAVGWHRNGQKKGEGNFKDGNRDGLIVEWYENGQKLGEGNFKNDKKEGLWVQWDENGQKWMEQNFKDGKSDGLWTVWHENGQKQFEENWKDGKLVEGSEKYWNSKGEPVDSLEEAEAE